MPWYRAGTVSVTLNSNAVIGTGTAFLANSRVGDAFLGPDGGWYEINNIASNTALSITPNYRSATNAAGVYALTPVQGYTKDLADQVRSMIQQWGATLAGLGSVSTENIVPVAKGGTGGSTQAAARNGLGLGSAAVAALLGPVSQVGGVPTGAVFESGSNANGTYVKFADGTMICQRLVTTLVDMTANQLKDFGNMPIAAQFASSAFSVVATGIPTSTFDTYGFTTSYSVNSNTVRIVYRNGATAQTIGTTQILCIGRWF